MLYIIFIVFKYCILCTIDLYIIKLYIYCKDFVEPPLSIMYNYLLYSCMCAYSIMHLLEMAHYYPLLLIIAVYVYINALLL